MAKGDPIKCPRASLHGLAKDLRRKRFGMLKVVQRVEGPHRNSGIWWECLCDCGTTKVLRCGDLSRTKSCGCLRVVASRERMLKIHEAQRVKRRMAAQ